MTSAHTDEYVVRVPKQMSKKYNVMKFNASDRVDIRNWVEGSLTRDLSAKKIYVEEEIYPEFGEGSEYGRKQREQARKLKYGRKKVVFNESDQPWNLKISTIENQQDLKKKVNGKVPTDLKPNVVMKEFSGKKEGGIGEGSMYFVFIQRPDCAFEAYPAADWYNFRRKISHRTLTDEEAEAAWDKRDKILNHLNYMARQRLHIKDEEEEGENSEVKSEVKKAAKKKKPDVQTDLVIHDDEDLELYMSDSSSEDEEGSSSKKKKKKVKKEASDNEKEEAIEDSDDGEHEGDEVAYASDVSSENEEGNDSRVVPKGLDEQESSSSSEDEEDQNKTESKENDAVNKLIKGSDDSATSSESGSDIEDDDSLSKSALFMNLKKQKDKKGGKSSKGSSRSSTPTSEIGGSTPTKSKISDVAKKLDNQGRLSPLVGSSSTSVLGKRGAPSSSGNDSSTKRPKMFSNSPPARESSQSGITEEAVKKYLTHKPITTKDLLKKFKTKKTGLSSEEIVNRVAMILKKLNPDKKNINGRLHLFLKGT